MWDFLHYPDRIVPQAAIAHRHTKGQPKSRGGIEFVADLPRTGKFRRVELRQQEAARIARLRTSSLSQLKVDIRGQESAGRTADNPVAPLPPAFRRLRDDHQSITSSRLSSSRPTGRYLSSWTAREMSATELRSSPG